ncbi:MAG: hypothetical protein Q4Q23_06230, partial [Methanobacteriaceae archaeon]|nr:hypothetical protein [Methanobacteriaceae archaeon]
NSGQPVQISNCSFNNNTATEYGGAVYNYGTLIITTSNFTKNQALSRGGAIFNTGRFDNITVSNSNFKNNLATTYGGAIAGSGSASKWKIYTSLFENNNASAGGAIVSASSLLKWEIYDSTFINNHALSSSKTFIGGAIYNRATSTTIDIYNSIFINNTAKTSGGALGYNGSSSIYSIENSIFKNCVAITSGGAVYTNQSSGMTILFSNFTSCSSLTGGAIYYINTLNEFSILGCNFINNCANSGGAIYNEVEKCNVTGSTFYNNTVNSIYSSKYLDALYNWWGSNQGNMSSCNSLVNTTCPIVLMFTVQNNRTDSSNPNALNYKTFYIDINHYNSTGNLKLLDHKIQNRIAIFNTSRVSSISFNDYRDGIIYDYYGYFTGLTVTVDGQQVSLPPNFKYQTYVSFDDITSHANTTITITATVHNFRDVAISETTRVVIKINGRTISTLDLLNYTGNLSPNATSQNGQIRVNYTIPDYSSKDYQITIVTTTNSIYERSETIRTLHINDPSKDNFSSNSLDNKIIINNNIDSINNNNIIFDYDEEDLAIMEESSKLYEELLIREEKIRIAEMNANEE